MLARLVVDLARPAEEGRGHLLDRTAARGYSQVPPVQRDDALSGVLEDDHSHEVLAQP